MNEQTANEIEQALKNDPIAARMYAKVMHFFGDGVHAHLMALTPGFVAQAREILQARSPVLWAACMRAISGAGSPKPSGKPSPKPSGKGAQKSAQKSAKAKPSTPAGAGAKATPKAAQKGAQKPAIGRPGGLPARQPAGKPVSKPVSKPVKPAQSTARKPLTHRRVSR